MQPLPRERLPEVVEEVDRLAHRQGTETIDRAAAEAALREVGLPAELLDEALRQIAARERQKRKNRLIAAGAAAGIVVALGVGALFVRSHAQHESAVAAIHARQAVVSYAEDQDSPVPAVERNGARDVYFNVVLVDMPMGSPLHMECKWTDAHGDVTHVSSWDTKPVNKTVWPTHCRTKIGASAATGNWNVTMLAAGHEVAKTGFEVK